MNFQSKLILTAALIASFFLVTSLNVSADTTDDDEDHEHCGGDYWADNVYGFWVIPMLFMGVIIVLIFVAFVGNDSLNSSKVRHSNSVKIAKERYASGDIDQKEYFQIMRDLK